MKRRKIMSKQVGRMETLESRRLMSASYGVNLVANPGAENFSGTPDGKQVIVPTGWTAQGIGGPTVCPYGSGYGTTIGIKKPSDGGNDFFSGGFTAGEGDFFQTIDLSALKTDLATGNVKFSLSAELGGNGTQTDNASVFVNFYDSGKSFLDQVNVGPVLPADRGNTTELVARSLNSTVPAGTTSVQVQIHFEYESGTYDDAFADNLAFSLVNPHPPTGGSVSGTVTGGKAGETVYLDANNSSTLNTGELSTVTSSTGTYSFSNVPAGAYVVRQVLPTGYTQETPSGGLGIHVTVTNGGSLTNENFTDKAPTASGGSVSGTVTGGKAGETVYLDANNNSKLDSGEFSTTTSSSGAYSITGVPAGAYVVRQVLPTGYTQTAPSGGLGIHVTVTNGGSLTNANFTDKAPAASGGSVSGTVTGGKAGETVYLDANNNSKLDSGEFSTTTSSTGAYSITGVAAGAYVVRQVLPTGYTQVTPSGGLGIHVTVASNSTLTNENFTDKGSAAGTASIAGAVFIDTNGDGKADNGESGFASVVLYLDLNNSGNFVTGDPTVTTDSIGDYLFGGLAAGNYIVRVETPAGYTQTAPSGGLGQHITVGTGSKVTGVVFGEKLINRSIGPV